jgi:hypothetical protein
VNVLVGSVSALLGVAYLALGVIAAQELVAGRRTLGMSRFGLGYILMASSCGPHHLLHASHVLHGQDVSLAVAAATLLGLPSGVVFVGLRIEAMVGGRGDRFVAGTPNWLITTAFGAHLSAGAIFATAAGEMRASQLTSVTFLANAFVAVTYALVGWPLLRTQMRRRAVSGGWSVAGISLATIFPTCAVSHLVYALTARGDLHTAIVDMWGVPASIYFLWVVRALYRDAISDWNTRPAAGTRRSTPRVAPWQPPEDARRAPVGDRWSAAPDPTIRPPRL